MIFDKLSYRKFLSKFLLSSILPTYWILQKRVSRSAHCRSANSSWNRACSRLNCSYPVRICPISTAWESMCLTNSQKLFSERSALYSSLRISDFASASNCSLVFPNSYPNLTVVSLASRSRRRYTGDASEFLVCTSSISASGYFASSSPRMYTVLTFETWKNEVTSSRSSVKFLLDRSSTFYTWHFLQFLHVSHIPDTSFTKIPILFWILLWFQLQLISPGVLTPCNSMINFHSLRLNNSSWFLDTSSVRLRLEIRASGISVLTSARICSFCISKRVLICLCSRSRLDFRFWDKFELGSYTGLSVLVSVKKDWAGNKLSSWEWRVCLKLAGSPCSWVNSCEDGAFLVRTYASSTSHEYDGSVVYVNEFILEDHCTNLWVVGVVELVGLTTCERVVYRQKSTPPHCAWVQVVLILGGFDHMEVDEQDREQVDSERRSRGSREREREDKTRNKQRTLNMWHHGWHADGVECAPKTPWATMVVCTTGLDERSSIARYLSTPCAKDLHPHFRLNPQQIADFLLHLCPFLLSPLP